MKVYGEFFLIVFVIAVLAVLVERWWGWEVDLGVALGAVALIRVIRLGNRLFPD